MPHCPIPNKSPSPTKNQWLFLVPLKGGRWHIIPQLALYTTYILPSGGLYATYHLLGEPETTIEKIVGKNGLLDRRPHLRTHRGQQAIEDDVRRCEVQLATQQLIGTLTRLHLEGVLLCRFFWGVEKRGTTIMETTTKNTVKALSHSNFLGISQFQDVLWVFWWKKGRCCKVRWVTFPF